MTWHFHIQLQNSYYWVTVTLWYLDLSLQIRPRTFRAITDAVRYVEEMNLVLMHVRGLNEEKSPEESGD